MQRFGASEGEPEPSPILAFSDSLVVIASAVPCAAAEASFDAALDLHPGAA